MPTAYFHLLSRLHDEDGGAETVVQRRACRRRRICVDVHGADDLVGDR